MDIGNAQGAPLMAAFLVLIAVVVLGGIAFTFSGSIQF